MLGALAAVFGAIDLVFDLSNRACQHSLMKRRYFELLASVLIGAKTIKDATADVNRFSADEEPAFHALLALSWNAAQEMVFGDKAYRYKLPIFARTLKNLCRYEGSQFKVIAPQMQQLS
jgi:hypothetical protein